MFFESRYCVSQNQHLDTRRAVGKTLHLIVDIKFSNFVQLKSSINSLTLKSRLFFFDFSSTSYDSEKPRDFLDASSIKSAAGLKFACNLSYFSYNAACFRFTRLCASNLQKKKDAREFRGATRSSGPESEMLIVSFVFLLFARP